MIVNPNTLVNVYEIDDNQECPGRVNRHDFIHRLKEMTLNRPLCIKPDDRRGLRVVVNHVIHNKDRGLVNYCIDVLIRRGFRFGKYNPGDYTTVVSRARGICCTKTKLFLEYVYFFRTFHARSNCFSICKVDLKLLNVIRILWNETDEDLLLDAQYTSPDEVAIIYEYQQIMPVDEPMIMTRGFDIAKLDNLDFFRQAQAIRDRFHIVRAVRAYRCFESVEEIDSIQEKLNEDDPIEFLVQAYALGLVDSRLLRTMYHTPKSYDHLVALFDKTADIRAEYANQLSNYEHGRQFVAAFGEVRHRIPDWAQSLLLFLTGISCPEGWHLPVTRPETVPDNVLHLYLNYLLVYSYKCLTKPECRIDDLELMNNLTRLPGILDVLIGRGASLDFAVETHEFAKMQVFRVCPSVLLRDAYFEMPCTRQSTAGTLMRLALLRRELSFGNWLRSLCCPVKKEISRFVTDTGRLATLQCLAARAYKLDRDVAALPCGLRPTILFHLDFSDLIDNHP